MAGYVVRNLIQSLQHIVHGSVSNISVSIRYRALWTRGSYAPHGRAKRNIRLHSPAYQNDYFRVQRSVSSSVAIYIDVSTHLNPTKSAHTGFSTFECKSCKKSTQSLLE